MTISLGAIWVRFDHPAWLLAGLTAFLPVMLAMRNRRLGGGIPRIRVILQSLALLLAAASLAGPVVSFAMRSPRRLLLRDVSASVGEPSAVELNLPAAVEFDRHSFAGRMLGEDERDALDATRIRPALDWSAAAIQAGRADGAILLTDGLFQDDWQDAARAYAQTGAPLWIVPLDAPPTDARIAAFSAVPTKTAETDRVAYSLAVTAQSNAPTRRTVTFYRIAPGKAKQVLAENEIVLEPDRPTTIHMRDILPTDSTGVWLAELSPHDTLSQNDTLHAASLPNRSRVAWVAAASRSAAMTSEANVASISPADAPSELTGWLGYSAVVLADASGTLLSSRQRSALAAYVRGGGGLVLLGAGPHEKPADRDDPLNRILPLRADPFERNPLNLTVVLDASGSMAEMTGSPAQAKWSLAGQAVLSLRGHLTPTDRLRVIVFSDDARTIYDSRPAGPDVPALAEALRDVSPAGPTNIAPALKRATDVPPVDQSENGSTARTHLVLVLSDLQTAPFNPAAMAKRFEERRSRLAVVATEAADAETTPLAQLARRLDAPLVYREHLQGLADVFAGLCRQARGEAIRHGDFTVRYEAAGPGSARIQNLNAYIPAASVGEALVDARIVQTGDPLIAAGLAGLGKCVVVSAPPEAIFAQPGGEQTIAERISRITRSADDPRFDVQITRNAVALHIRVTVREGETAVNHLSLRAEVIGLSDPSSEVIPVECVQTAPGIYEADLPSAAGNGQSLAVRVLDGSGKLCRQGVAPARYPAEFARLGADYEQLRELANLTGGRIIAATDVASPAIQEELRQPRRSGKAVWPITLSCSIAAMLLAWLGGKWGMRRGP